MLCGVPVCMVSVVCVRLYAFVGVSLGVQVDGWAGAGGLGGRMREPVATRWLPAGWVVGWSDGWLGP